MTFIPPEPALGQVSLQPGDIYAIKTLNPDVWSLKWVRLALLDWLKVKAREINSMYRQTVSTWSTKPTFAILKRSFTRAGSMSIITGGNINTGRGQNKDIHPAALHGMIDRGVEFHRVDARRVPFLVFGSDFSPKTIPGTLTVTTGIRGGHVVRQKSVWVDVEPRGWTDIIVDQVQATMAAEAADVISKAIIKGNAGPG
jgi:hypothetical protein